MLRGAREIPSLRLELHASRALGCALMLAHTAAAGADIFAVPGGLLCALASAALAASLWRTLRRHALLIDPAAVVELDFRGECECSITRLDGSQIVCQVQGSTYATCWLVVLHLQSPDRRLPHQVVLAPDSVASDRFRRLLVRLRWASPYDARVRSRDAPL